MKELQKMYGAPVDRTKHWSDNDRKHASLPTQGQQGVYIVDWLRGRFHFLSRLFHAFDLEYIYLDNSLQYIVSVGYPHVYVCSKLIPLERVRMYSSGITGTRTLFA